MRLWSRWQTLAPVYRRFLITQELIGAAICNFLLNAGVAAFFYHAKKTVPLWGWSSIASDVISTAFILPLLTAVIAACSVWLQVRGGQLPLLALADAEERSTWWSRRTMMRRAALVGLAAIVVIALPTVLLLTWAGCAQMGFWKFVLFKAAFAAGVGIPVTPLLGYWAVLAASREPPRANTVDLELP